MPFRAFKVRSKTWVVSCVALLLGFWVLTLQPSATKAYLPLPTQCPIAPRGAVAGSPMIICEPTDPPTETNTRTPTNTRTFTPTATRTNTPTATSTPVPRVDTIGIYRPSNNTFYLRASNSTGPATITVQYGYNCGGIPCNYPIVGDWNGDGVDTIGIYDQVAGIFKLRNQNTAGPEFYFAVLGNPNDQPLAGRWSADMTHDGIGVFRQSNGILYLKKDIVTGFSDFFAVMGNPGDVGVAGDWNDDGLDTVGIYRPSASRFYITNNNAPAGITFSDADFAYGDGSQDKPLVGDWIGDGASRVGAFRNGTVMLRYSLNTGAPDLTFNFGMAGDIPVAGKWGAPNVPARPVGAIIAPVAPSVGSNAGGDTAGSAD